MTAKERAQKQAELLSSQLASKLAPAPPAAAAASTPAAPLVLDIAAIAKAAAAANAGIAAINAAAARPSLPSASHRGGGAPLVQHTEGGGMMATNANGVGRVFYPPAAQPSGWSETGSFERALPPAPEGGGYVKANGGVGRVFYPPSIEQQKLEQQAAAAAASQATAERSALSAPSASSSSINEADEALEQPRRRRRGFTEEGGEERREERRRRSFREEAPERPAAPQKEHRARAPPPPVPTFSDDASMPPPPPPQPPPPSERAAAHDLEQYGLLPPRPVSEAGDAVAAVERRWGGNTSLMSFVPADELAQLQPGANSNVASAEAALGSGNLGHQMLSQMGWSDGRGLGARGDGLVAPVAAGRPEAGKHRPGLGSSESGATTVPTGDDELELYKKRMSLGYQYRKNAANSGPQNTFMPGTVPPPRGDR